MNWKNFLPHLFIIATVFIFLQFGVDIVKISFWVLLLSLAYSTFVDIKQFFFLKKTFESYKKCYFHCVILHKARYKLYFKDDYNQLETCCETFDEISAAFLTTEETIHYFNKKQQEKILKMLSKTREMRENTYVRDYSI